MKLHFVLAMFILAWPIETGLCQEAICETTRGVIKCCVDFRKINGSCILCPAGYFGLNCNTICPDGLYGTACRKKCECDEEETCDPMHGCVLNFTETNVSATTEVHFTVTRQIEVTHDNMLDVFPWQYVYLTPGGVLVFLIAVCLFVRHRKKNVQNENAVGSVNEVSAVEIENLPVPIVPLQPTLNQGATGSDYAEIRECLSVYGDSHEVSSIYNVLSFSRNITTRQTHGSIQAVYDTSQLPALRNEALLNPEAIGRSMDDTIDITNMRNERKSCPM